MTEDEHRLLVIGAHPDDADFRAGGLAARATANGDAVTFVSMTDGSAGHHELGPDELADRRRAEATAAGAVCGLEYVVRSTRDGRLRPSLAERDDVIRLIRRVQPDLILTHRPNDYHPDHRYTAQLVRDAAFMVMVPNVCPEVDPLAENPAIAYVQDDFDRPYPFDPDLFVEVTGEALAAKYEMIACHESQTFEWLPHLAGILEDVPDDPDARREWLDTDPLSTMETMAETADRHREALAAAVGPAAAGEITYVEPFEVSEYGGSVPDHIRDAWFV